MWWRRGISAFPSKCMPHFQHTPSSARRNCKIGLTTCVKHWQPSLQCMVNLTVRLTWRSKEISTYPIRCMSKCRHTSPRVCRNFDIDRTNNICQNLAIGLTMYGKILLLYWRNIADTFRHTPLNVCRKCDIHLISLCRKCDIHLISLPTYIIIWQCTWHCMVKPCCLTDMPEQRFFDIPFQVYVEISTTSPRVCRNFDIHRKWNIYWNLAMGFTEYGKILLVIWRDGANKFRHTFLSACRNFNIGLRTYDKNWPCALNCTVNLLLDWRDGAKTCRHIFPDVCWHFHYTKIWP